MNEWISVEEKLPDPRVEDNVYPLVLALKQGMCTKLYCIARWNGCDWIEKGKEIGVTYWQPLPPLPNEKR